MRILTIFFQSINKETYGIKNSALAAVSKNNVLLFHWCLYSFSNQSWEFLLIKWRHHYHWRASNFDQYSAPHLLWHGSSVYNGHLQGQVTPAPFAEHSVVELSLPVLRICRSNPNLLHVRWTLYHWATATIKSIVIDDEVVYDMYEKTKLQNWTVYTDLDTTL